MDYVVEYYENYKEEERFSTNNARKIEFITSTRALDALLPLTARVLDCAAGTGAYAFYYAEKGYNVTALDIAPRHVEVMNEQMKQKRLNLAAAVNDATDLSRFEDQSFDVVLCMGPMYHITEKAMRDRCYSECVRVLREGGLLVTAYISRFFIFPHVALSDNAYLNAELAKSLTKTGTLKHDDPNCFWTESYYSTPEEMEKDYKENSLEVIDHLAADGLAPILREKVDALDEMQFQTWCEYHYSICREKSILGASNHGLIVGRKQTGSIVPKESGTL
jgi:2-polyprenyl-3-methyl-5-hydroxy-6-metoxy-1,4-benzoquinol methylase